MLDKFLSAVFDEEHEFNDIWELKLVKFDVDSQAPQKPYEKYLAVSSYVQDTKGNPGIKGNFVVSNLRIVWYASSDRQTNLSIGFDTINNVTIKNIQSSGMNDLKYQLILKCQSPSQTKYEFKFTGHNSAQQLIFKKIIEIHKKFIDTKLIRNIDTNIKKRNNQQLIVLDNQEIKTTYQQCIFQEEGIEKDVTLILTNIRLVIIHQKNNYTNYGIPWIMIQKFTKIQKNNREVLELHIRGLLKNIDIFLSSKNRADFNKMNKEMISFCQTYNKNPNIGVNFSFLDNNNFEKQLARPMNSLQVQEIEQTKVNIGRKKNAYGMDNQKGSIKRAFFNEQLGIMMQELPEGYSRKDLWQILR